MTKDKDRTKEHLVTQLAVLRQQVSVLEKALQEYQQLTSHLKERAKELSCMYAIDQIIDDRNATLYEIYQQVADVLPTGWQYPEIARARIVMGDHEFKTWYFRETEWKLSCDIEVFGAKIGTVELCYSEKKPEMDQELFLREEWLLISIVAGRLGRITEIRRAGH